MKLPKIKHGLKIEVGSVWQYSKLVKAAQDANLWPDKCLIVWNPRLYPDGVRQVEA